jgi:RimJ/RimL family protein N-acetyltransferase
MIREIDDKDLSLLRLWKNTHKEAFFHKEDISEEEQIAWFKLYQDRHDDYMFMVMEESTCIGCMGIRLIDEIGKTPVWDIYNVILGVPEYGGKGYMSQALSFMIQRALCKCLAPVTARVINGNHAENWYRNNGFGVTFKDSTCCVMTYQGNDT